MSTENVTPPVRSLDIYVNDQQILDINGLIQLSFKDKQGVIILYSVINVNDLMQPLLERQKKLSQIPTLSPEEFLKRNCPPEFGVEGT